MPVTGSGEGGAEGGEGFADEALDARGRANTMTYGVAKAATLGTASPTDQVQP